MGEGVPVAIALRERVGVLTGVLKPVWEKDMDREAVGVAAAVRVRDTLAVAATVREAVLLLLTPRVWLLVGVALRVGVSEAVTLVLAEEEPELLGVLRGVAVGGSTAQLNT